MGGRQTPPLRQLGEMPLCARSGIPAWKSRKIVNSKGVGQTLCLPGLMGGGISTLSGGVELLKGECKQIKTSVSARSLSTFVACRVKVGFDVFDGSEIGCARAYVRMHTREFHDTFVMTNLTIDVSTILDSITRRCTSAAGVWRSNAHYEV